MQEKEKYSLIRRIYFIHRQINDYGKVSKKEVSEKFGVSIRTVTSDIATMRDDFNAKIIPSKEFKGYYVYDKPFHLFDDFTDEKMVISYSFIKSIIESSAFIPYVSNLILKDVQSILPNEYINLSEKIVYELSQYEQIDERNFRKIIDSFIQKKKIKIEYLLLDGSISKGAVIEPLKLINFSGKWHLVSYCYWAEEIRNYRLAGIKLIENTDENFENPVNEKELDNIIKQNYGIYIAQDEGDFTFAKVRFYNDAYIEMKRINASQETKYDFWNR